ncbi:MAG: BspA family leucine-rich repeat surface protein [Ruminococcus sp.]|nr:BspA family leucine-rich repeat surface protein [Ruminococcus sp.]
MLEKLKRRIVSGAAALAMLAGSTLSLLPVTAADDGAAHTINVFDISLRQGADFYSQYVPEDPSDSGVTSLSNAYVWQPESSNDGHKFVYNIKFSVSGQGTTNSEFIKIRIPAHILKLKGQSQAGIPVNGEYPDELEMPVPNIDLIEYREVPVTDENGDPVIGEDGEVVTKKEYITNREFVYELDEGDPDDPSDDAYVIYNLNPVSAGVVYEFPIAYRMNMNTWEYEDLAPSDPCQASVTVNSWKEDDPDELMTLTKESREIPVHIDTSAKIESTVKKAGSTLITADEAEQKFGLSDLDTNYRYTIWTVTSVIPNATQKYALKLSDAVSDITGFDAENNEHTVKGEFVAAKMGGKITNTLSGLTASGTRVDYVLTRYPYNATDDSEGIADLRNAPKNATYKANNHAEVTLTPEDGQDAATSKDSTASFKVEVKDPVWYPVEESYSADKYGLYNNGANKVTGKSSVSSYELAKLKDDKEVSGLKYLTQVMAHAYGKTIASLNDEITAMIVPSAIGEDGIAVITAGSRKYTFDTENGTCTLTLYTDDQLTEEISSSEIDVSGYDELSLLNMQRIAAQDIADNYYGQRPVDYVFTDNTFVFGDSSLSEPVTLDEGDYRIDSFEYKYTVRAASYDPENMEFSEGLPNEGLSEDPAENQLELYVFPSKYSEPVLAARYDIASGSSVIIEPSLVQSFDGEKAVFNRTADITGYQLKTTNTYFYISLDTTPSVTLKPSDTVKNIVVPILDQTDKEKKVALKNTANWSVFHSDGEPLLDTPISGTDYLADIVRSSNISKKALGEKTIVKGQDGNTYKSRNDTLNDRYELVWQSRIYETANGVEVNGTIQNNIPVPQRSGIFYDLLPAHSDIIEGSVNVYVDGPANVNQTTKSLPPSSFEVLDRIDNYNGSGRKLLVIKINEPCSVSYAVTYATIHAHEDIQDYGSYALNTVAYQTGNSDIGNGYPDDGGNHAVSMSNYIKDLDPDNNGAKRFIYAESTEDILALFPTSSGIYKKVSTKSDPTYRKSGVVYNGSTYTYNIRMQNDSATKARDIAILDSIENFRTVDGETYNAGLKTDRDWHGTLVSIDLSGIENKLAEYSKTHSNTSTDDLKLILYVGDDPDTDIVDLEGDDYSDNIARKELLKQILRGNTTGPAAKWHVVDDWRDLSGVDLENVTAFMVYTGEHFVLGKGDSMSFSVKMTAPETLPDDRTADPENGLFLSPAITYNNVYRSFTSIPEDAADDTLDRAEYYYTHYDYTQLTLNTVGDLRFIKADSKTKKPIQGAKFSLTGISDYGTSYNETMISDSNGVVLRKSLERGTYDLVEIESDSDHLMDTTTRTVTVDMNGNVSIDPILYSDAGEPSVYNDPRYHADLKFRKTDSLSGAAISGAVFTLSGTSIYNNQPEVKEVVSESNGMVVFPDLEKGDYTLTETIPGDGYLPPVVNTYSVTSVGDDPLIFRISGENCVNVGTEYQIRNVPAAEMPLQKVDSITKDILSDAKFTLTAGNDLDATLQNLTKKVSGTGWEKVDGSWVQVIDNSNTPNNSYLFKYLPEGSYTLTEDRAPNGYAEKTKNYEINVVKSSDGKALLIQLPDDMKYIKLEGGDFTETDQENAAYYRLLNDETYEDGKTVIKSWVGGVDSSFPSMHLSTEKPEAGSVKVTIGTDFKTLISNNKANMTGLVKETTLPEGKTLMVDRTGDAADETGSFYAWWDSTDKKIHWYSDADIIYMPRDCESLFSGLNNNEINIDLSDFDFSKVTTMQAMFSSVQGNSVYGKHTNVTKIKTITFPSDIDTSNVTNMDGMFYGCNQLTTLDLTGFDTANVTSMQAMFRSCSKLEEIKLDSTKFTDDSLTTVYRMFDECSALKQIDFRGFKGEKLENAQSWFAQCKHLEYIDLSNFNGGSKITILNWTFQNLGSQNANGCAIFSNKWELKNVTGTTDTLSGTKLNLYGKTYTPDTYNIANFDIATEAETGGTTSLSGDNKANRYFNDPNGAYYTTFFDETYRNINNTVTQPTPTPVDVTFGDYTNFEKDGSATQVKNTTATADDVGKTSFTFEYVTKETPVPTSGTEPFEVDEIIYLTVSQIIEEDGAYYTVSQNYTYNDTVKAKWTQVSGTAPTQWYCQMNVMNADEEFFAWETPVAGYISTADENTPVKTVGRSDKPVITNAKEGTPIGELVLEKKFSGDVPEKFDPDVFWFKVTMKTPGGEPYTMEPFDENGAAYFPIRPYLKDDDIVRISGIPSGCTYVVEEIVDTTDPNHPMAVGYTKITSGNITGTIPDGDSVTAQIENRMDTTDLTLKKEVELWKKTDKDGDFTKVTDTTDPDYTEWAGEDFTFTVTFDDLAVGQPYDYYIDGTRYTDLKGSKSSQQTVKTLTIKGGQTVVFKDLPVGTVYTVSEGALPEDTEEISYEVKNQTTGGNPTVLTTGSSTRETTLGTDPDTVTFTNIKNIDETLLDETVEMPVTKEWYDTNGDRVLWTFDDSGNVISPADYYPSFLKVYIGRAMKMGDGEGAVYLDMEPGFDSYSLKANEDWSYTFTDLPKYGEVTFDGVTTRYPYVYFVTEVVPIGFCNINEPDDFTTIEDVDYIASLSTDEDMSITLKNQNVSSYDLSISKIVTGNMGNKMRDFDFEVTFTTPSGAPLIGTGLLVRFTDENDPTYLRNRTYTIDSGKISISLKHGQKCTFLTVPDNTRYTIRELNDSYTVKSGTFASGLASEQDLSSLTGGSEYGFDHTLTLTGDTNYLFVNDMSGEIPVGISLSLVAPLFMFVPFGTILFIGLRRKRKEEEV